MPTASLSLNSTTVSNRKGQEQRNSMPVWLMFTVLPSNHIGLFGSR
ncbi:MAG: hypothetical protein ABSA41_02550 [Terriglobia bacterium]|jgi:hypothetical protein